MPADISPPTTNRGVHFTLESETPAGVAGEGGTSWRIRGRRSKEEKWTEVNGNGMNMPLRLRPCSLSSRRQRQRGGTGRAE